MPTDSETPAAPGEAAASVPDESPALARHAARASAGLDRALHRSGVLDRLPGRSVTLLAVGLVGVAIALSTLPWFSGTGLVWSVVMLAGGAAVALRELRPAEMEAPAARLPAALRHPLLPPAYAALVALHAFLLLRVGVVPLLWAAAAVLLVREQWRRAARDPGGPARRVDLRRGWRGWRRNVTAGVGLCLASMFLTWGRSSGYWTGGYAYDYAYRYDSGSGTYGYGYDYGYQPMQYYWPGWETSGRNQSFALLAVALLLALALWAALRPEGAPGRRLLLAGPAMGGALALFWLAAAKDGVGSLLFLAGLASILWGAVRIARGEEEGRWDLERVGGRAAAWARSRRASG